MHPIARLVVVTLAAAAATMAGPLLAEAQPLGSFTWQLQPFCNRVTVNVRQDGAVYTLDGFDDQCGAGQRATLVGLATPNPDGTIGFGLNIVTTGGKAVQVDARVSLPSGSGPWTDNAGNTGTFALGANTGGSPRPPAGVGLGDVTAVLPGTGLTGGGAAGDLTLSVNPAVVQSRVTQSCPAGQALRAVAQNGTVTCEPVSGGTGDITAVSAGLGLVGGAVTGDATLAVVFGGDGVAAAAARADHEHAANATSVAIGPGALPLASGVSNTAVGGGALALSSTGNENTALGFEAMAATTTGSDNTAVGDEALGGNTTGSANTAVGENALDRNVTGSRNTAIGNGADVASAALVNATAIGANAWVGAANALVLGSINGVNGATSGVNVGIGTTSPNGRLEIATQEFATDILIRTADGAPDLVTQASEGTLGSPIASSNGTLLFILRGQGHTGTLFEAGANLLLRTTEAWTSTAHGTRFEFQTAANGSVTPLTRMLIDHDGEVGIGTSTPLDTLQVVGNIRVGTSGTNGCVKNFAGTGILGVCSSDLRFKRDVTPFGSSLDRVAALRPVHYFWRTEAFPEKGFGSDQAYGLIAQDVEQVLPELVSVDADGYKAVDYSKLPLLAIQAIKELQGRNDALERRLAALERALTTSKR